MTVKTQCSWHTGAGLPAAHVSFWCVRNWCLSALIQIVSVSGLYFSIMRQQLWAANPAVGLNWCYFELGLLRRTLCMKFFPCCILVLIFQSITLSITTSITLLAPALPFEAAGRRFESLLCHFSESQSLHNRDPKLTDGYLGPLLLLWGFSASAERFLTSTLTSAKDRPSHALI